MIDSILWAIKHTERNMSEMGLEILKELFDKLNQTNMDISNSFYGSFYVLILHEVLGIVTDRLHKSGFTLQVDLLFHLFGIVQRQPFVLANVNSHSVAENVVYVQNHLVDLLFEAFPNMTKNGISVFVANCFNTQASVEQFRDLFRDFLITVKEFEAEDNSEFYLMEKEKDLEEERKMLRQYRESVPGLMKPEDMLDNNYDAQFNYDDDVIQ